MPRPIATLDMETDPFDGKCFPAPFIAGIYTENSYEEFSEKEHGPEFLTAMIRYLMDKEWVVYAHNGGKFDYHFMLDFLTAGDKIMLINGRLSRFYIGLCEFRDSYNILPAPLRDFAKDDFNYQILDKNQRYQAGNFKKIQRYLFTDCQNLYNTVARFIEEYGRSLTLAGAAMKQWEKIDGAKAPQSEPEFYDDLARYYYGGRVQCFAQGHINKSFSSIDINSAYPRAMLEQHPYSLRYEEKHGNPFDDYSRDEIGPMLITVCATAMGCFPFRVLTGKEKGTYYPVDTGARLYHITGWELLAALDTSMVYIVEYISYCVFQETKSFAPYIHHFYNRRLEAKKSKDKTGDTLNKLFLNSLYGKFAADPRRYMQFALWDREDIALIKKPETGRDFGGLLGPWALSSEPLPEEGLRFFNIATAASITGYVRAALWRAICASDTPLYCDTDSLAAVGFGADIDYGAELGQWEIEGEYKQGWIVGKKSYAFEYTRKWHNKLKRKGKDNGKPIPKHKTASKGVRLTAQELIKVANGAEIVHSPQAPSYSAHKEPHYIKRRIRVTAKDSKKLPGYVDNTAAKD